MGAAHRGFRMVPPQAGGWAALFPTTSPSSSVGATPVTSDTMVHSQPRPDMVTRRLPVPERSWLLLQARAPHVAVRLLWQRLPQALGPPAPPAGSSGTGAAGTADASEGLWVRPAACGHAFSFQKKENRLFMHRVT